MNWYRMKHTIGLCLRMNPMKRAEYIKQHHIFQNVGKNCMFMPRKIPLYPQLISFGDNVWIGSGVSFITHDVTHHMLNYKYKERIFKESIGCIRIDDNVFIGGNVTLTNNIHIGENVVIGAGSIVTRDLGKDGVYAGVPARRIMSIEAFIEKRRKYSEYSAFLEPGNETLSAQEIEELWKSFDEKRIR